MNGYEHTVIRVYGVPEGSTRVNSFSKITPDSAVDNKLLVGSWNWGKRTVLTEGDQTLLQEPPWPTDEGEWLQDLYGLCRMYQATGVKIW